MIGRVMGPPGSLIARLSRRLVMLQILALALVVAVAAIPEPERRGLQEIDDDALSIIAAGLRAEGGLLFVPELSELMAEIADAPGFWFVVADAAGRQGAYGPVPAGVQGLAADLGRIVEIEVYWDQDATGRGMIGARMETAVGLVTILTGGGPAYSPVIARLKEINPVYLVVLALVMTGLALGIPWLLRRDLAGVARVADEAARIDIDQPGARLTEANVPPELQAMVGAMNAALSRLDEGLERRRRFLATAAHELRTPVTILSLRIEMLPPGPDRRQLTLDVARLAALANQLLDLERMDANHARSERLDLGALARDTVTDLAPLAISVGADLAYDGPDRPIHILADRQAIERVIINLVQNSLAHGGEGVSVRVAVSAPATIQVVDSGPGIAAADRDRVFEPFFRRATGPGSGLGLHLVKEIVTGHGGSIHLGETPGGGAEFILRFRPDGGAAPRAPDR